MRLSGHAGLQGAWDMRVGLPVLRLCFEVSIQPATKIIKKNENLSKETQRH
jgi:hypothetical protein